MKSRSRIKNSNVSSPVRRKQSGRKSASPHKVVDKSITYKQAHYLAISKLSKSDNSEVEALIESNDRILQANK